MDQLKVMQETIKKFCDERDWGQYHRPKELAIGVVTEASELLEHFRFLSDEACLKVLDHPESKGEIEDELVDVMFFILRFAQMYDVDLMGAFTRKMKKNTSKYPVESTAVDNQRY